MEYNTQKKKLIIPEYGRNIQEMVDYILTVEDKEERNKLARALVRVMGNISQRHHEHGDFKNKLWNNLALMSDFKLDIDYPIEVVRPKIFEEKPNKIPYAAKENNKRHYGRNIKSFIRCAAELKEGEERDTLIELIANHMKKSYMMWNKFSVNDTVIFDDLEKMSEGKIKVDRSIKLKDVRQAPNRNTNKKRMQRKKQ